MHYKFYYSWWSMFNYLLLGFGLIIVGLGMLLGSHMIVMMIFGSFLMVVGVLVQLITLHRLFTNPAVLDVGPDGILYRYGTFSNKKVINLPWQQIRDVKLGDITYRHYVQDVPVPMKLEYVTISVVDGYLKDYGMFKDNIYLDGNDLQIMTSGLRHFNVQYLLDGLQANRTTPDTEIATNEMKR